MGESQAKASASVSVGPVNRGAQFILCVLAVVMILDFVSFGSFWLGRALTSADWTQLGNNLRSAVWPEFLAEVQFYAKQDMLPVNLVLDKYLTLDRATLGNGGPFIDYLFLKLFRIAGLLTFLTGGLIVILFIAAEGYRRNSEKRLRFEKMSATIYHFTLKTGSLFATVFFLLYVFMPGKIVIPGLFEAQVSFILYSPYTWALVMTAIAGATVYAMVSNITNA